MESPRFVVQDSGLVICANQQTALRKNGTSNYRIYVLKVDAHGDTLWTRTYGNEKRESLIAGSLLSVSDGYLIAGTDWSVADPFLMKISSQGDSLWIKRYNCGIKTNYFVSAALAKDGACVLAAEGMSYDRKKRDYLPRGLVVMKTKPLPSK